MKDHLMGYTPVADTAAEAARIAEVECDYFDFGLDYPLGVPVRVREEYAQTTNALRQHVEERAKLRDFERDDHQRDGTVRPKGLKAAGGCYAHNAPPADPPFRLRDKGVTLAVVHRNGAVDIDYDALTQSLARFHEGQFDLMTLTAMVISQARSDAYVERAVSGVVDARFSAETQSKLKLFE